MCGLRPCSCCDHPGCHAPEFWQICPVGAACLQLARGIHPGDHRTGRILISGISLEITQDHRGRLPGYPYSWLLISAALEGDHRRGSIWQVPGQLQGDEQFRQLTNGKTYTVNTVKFLLLTMAVSRRRIFFNCSLQLVRAAVWVATCNKKL